jgi:hypothetical protein
MNKFAAYHEWLGIPLREETPNHYEILGIPLFETNNNVISNGAARRISFLQTMVASEFAELAQEIQKEVSRAKLCLLRENSRDKYQDELMKKFAEQSADQKMVKPENTFSVAAEFTDGSLELLVDETRIQNLKLAEQRIWLIGSSKDCDLVIKNQYVSRKHCLLFKKGDAFELEDWASTNGTYINSKRLAPRTRTPVSTQDIVTLGERTLMPWPPVTD